MTQIGEAASPPEADTPEDKEEEVKSIQVRYSVFFDGTLNNKANIDARLVSAKPESLTAEEKIVASELKNNMSINELSWAQGLYNKYNKVDSYENGYTNIVKLERNIDAAPQKPYDIGLSSYLEGAGTLDGKKDKTLGYALGVGRSGVKKKVKKGVSEVVKNISNKHTEKDVIIEVLTLDTFGFSRGAASARYFIYMALLDGKSVKQQLQDRGYKVKKVEFEFAGLFDTVSSHGLSFTNDTPSLKLDAVSFANKAVQLAAADEHREKFSLTDINSAKPFDAIQVYLPGVHSDVGGSYRDNSPDGLENGEKQLNIYWTLGSNSEQKALDEKKRLIESGWFKEDEIDLKVSTRHRPHGGSRHHRTKEASLYVGRSKVSNQYSRIPLHIMADRARDSKIKFKPSLNSSEKVPGSLSKANKEIKSYFDKHKETKASSAYTSIASDWHDNKRSWLKSLRHDYFHFSAHYSIGLSPRYKNGKRSRLVIHG